MIDLLLSVMAFVVIEHVTKCHYWIQWIDLIDTIPWFDLISSILWFDLISSVLWYDLIKPYLLILFNYFNPLVVTLTSTWKVAKDAPNHILENMVG